MLNVLFPIKWCRRSLCVLFSAGSVNVGEAIVRGSTSEIQDRVLDTLRATTTPLTPSQLRRKLPSYTLVAIGGALRELQSSGLVRQRNGAKWQVLSEATAHSAATSTPRGRKVSTEEDSGLHIGEAETDPVVAREGRWSEFRRLCLYYRDCLRIEQAKSLKVYSADRDRKYIEMPAKMDWHSPPNTSPMALTLAANQADFVTAFMRDKSNDLVIGGPVFARTGKDKETGEPYRMLVPVFLQRCSVTVVDRMLVLRPSAPFEVNEQWLKFHFKKSDAQRAFLELMGLVAADTEDDDSKPQLHEYPSLGQLYKSLQFYHRDLWADPLPCDPESPSDSSIDESGETGIFNRVILVRPGAMKYVAALDEELETLASKVDDEDLDGTALSILFPHEPPKHPATAAAGEQDRPASSNPPVASLERLNDEQIRACRLALCAPASVVTGPPGTGKSRVVLNVLGNLALRRRSGLFASRNHQAIEAVEPRLNALTEPDPLVVRLSRPFGDAGGDDLPLVLQNILSKPSTEHAESECARASDQLAECSREMADLTRELDLRFNAHVDFDRVEADFAYALTAFPELEEVVRSEPSAPSPDILRRYAHLYATQDDVGHRSIFRRVLRAILGRWARKRNWPQVCEVVLSMRQLFGAHVPPVSLEGGPPEGIAGTLEQLAAISEAIELAGRAAAARTRMEAMQPLEQIYERYLAACNRLVDRSQRALITASKSLGVLTDPEERERLGELMAGLQAYAGGSPGLRRLMRSRFSTLLSRVPLWATTNLSVSRTVPLEPNLFDLLVIDEASQCDIASVIPMLYRSRRAMVVGDPMQLPHVSKMARDVDERLRERHGLSDIRFGRYSYRVTSFFQLAQTSSTIATDHRVQLRQHHRCHPAIAQYCNESFYNETLEIMTDLRPVSGIKRSGIEWTQIADDCRAAPGGGAISDGQIQSILDHLQSMLASRFEGTVGVVSPFRAQTNRLRDTIRSHIDAPALERWNFHVDTADGFQGDERDVILLSLVGGRDMPPGAKWFYANNPNRFNVAVSRAKSLLHVFGDRQWALASDDLRHVKRLAEKVTSPEDFDPKNFRKDLVGPVWEPRLAEAMQQANLSFYQQYPACGRFLDFALLRPGLKLDVEVDGETYHRDERGERKAEDLRRDLVLSAAGWKVLRFWVYELKDDLRGCVDIVRRAYEATEHQP